MTRTEAIEVTGGGLSEPSKMPCPSYSLPARACLLGSKLVKVAGSVCHGCYALKGNYVRFPKVEARQRARLASIVNPAWEEGLIWLIRASKANYFRWHDSGDLQSLEHLERIVRVCQALPEVKFWLPTREYGIVQEWREGGKRVFPSNLVVRLSAHKVNGMPPELGLQTSSVHDSPSAAIGKVCHAGERENKCGQCRACWNPEIENVSYLKH